MNCKHNWNFVDGLTKRIRCTRCAALQFVDRDQCTDIVSDGALDPRNVFDAASQPEQEPVAHSVVQPLRPDEYQRRVSVKWVGQPVAGPLYTTPPQRKPLTDGELLAVYETEQQGRWGDHVRGLRAVEEAAHGIKGEV